MLFLVLTPLGEGGEALLGPFLHALIHDILQVLLHAVFGEGLEVSTGVLERWREKVEDGDCGIQSVSHLVQGEAVPVAMKQVASCLFIPREIRGMLENEIAIVD